MKEYKHNHKEVVHAENERRRLQKEEEERIHQETLERKRLKLEWKLRRRENRRLHNLENQFTQIYAATADIDKDIINVSDLDGSDNNGLKSIGLPGGLIGALYFLSAIHKEVDPEKALPAASFLQTMWNGFVGDGWNVFVALDGGFEKNISPFVEGLSIDKMDLDYIFSLSAEEQASILEYSKIHYCNMFWEKYDRTYADFRNKQIEKVKFVEPVPDDQNGSKDNPDDQTQPDAVATKGKAKKAEKEVKQPEPEPPAEEPAELSANVQSIQKFIDEAFAIIFSEKSHIKSVKFTKYAPKVVEEKKPDADQADADKDQTPPVPRVLSIFLPAKLAEDDEALAVPPQSKLLALDSKFAFSPSKPNQRSSTRSNSSQARNTASNSSSNSSKAS